MSQIFHLRLKPIFHCDAKLLELGARRNTKFAFPPTQTPNASESVEYRLCWVPNAKFLHWPCRSHVVYPVFLLCWVPNWDKRCSQWNMDFSLYVMTKNGKPLAFS